MLDFVSKLDLIDVNGNTNQYLEFNPVYKLKAVLIKNSNITYSNISKHNNTYKKYCEVEQYIDNYITHITPTKRKFKNKKIKNIEAYQIRFVLPRELNAKKDIVAIKEIIDIVVNQISSGENPMFFASIQKEKYESKKLLWVNIIMLDRHFYPKGKEIEKKCYSDCWVDSKNIRRNALDTEHGKLTLLNKKGDTYKKTIYVSNKLRFEGFASNPGDSIKKRISSFKNATFVLKKIITDFISKKINKLKLTLPKLIKAETYKKCIKKDDRWLHVNRKTVQKNKVLEIILRRKKACNNVIGLFNSLGALNMSFNDAWEHVYEYVTQVVKVIKSKPIREAEQISADIISCIKENAIFINPNSKTEDFLSWSYDQAIIIFDNQKDIIKEVADFVKISSQKLEKNMH